MKHRPHWPVVTRLRLGLARQQNVLTGVALPILLLGIAGPLLFTQAAFSLPAHAHVGRAAAVGPFKGRPTRTPTPTPTSTPVLTPTVTVTTDPTRAPTGTEQPSTGSIDSAGPGGEGRQTPTVPADAAPWWGLGVLVGTLLVFGAFILLFIRRTAHQNQSPALVSPPQKGRQGRPIPYSQMLPTRQAPQQAGEDAGDALREECQAWEPVPSAPLKPPRWLIEAGLLKEETGDLPAVNQEDR
jgi:hypothetical protein